MTGHQKRPTTIADKGGPSGMAIEQSDRTIILHLLRGTVPERANEIS